MAEDLAMQKALAERLETDVSTATARAQDLLALYDDAREEVRKLREERDLAALERDRLASLGAQEPAPQPARSTPIGTVRRGSLSQAAVERTQTTDELVEAMRDATRRSSRAPTPPATAAAIPAAAVGSAPAGAPAAAKRAPGAAGGRYNIVGAVTEEVTLGRRRR
jgi:hypothetical protein